MRTLLARTFNARTFDPRTLQGIAEDFDAGSLSGAAGRTRPVNRVFDTYRAPDKATLRQLEEQQQAVFEERQAELRRKAAGRMAVLAAILAASEDDYLG